MWWHILEVRQDDDQRTIKKAYSEMIKGVNQDCDIDNFTRIHQAYREAMKSFEKSNKRKNRFLGSNDETTWYIEELQKLYEDFDKRLQVSQWRNLFACMSFIEEEKFVKEYVTFFNEHYHLTDEIWKVIEAYYPLINQDGFKWKSLVRGQCCISNEEVEKIDNTKQFAYIADKIDVYYSVLNKDYSKANAIVEIRSDDYNVKEFITLALILEIDNNDKIKARQYFDKLEQLGLREDTFENNHIKWLYGSYLNCIKNYKESQEVLSEIGESKRRDHVQKLMSENEQLIAGKYEDTVQSSSWYELDYIPSRVKKLYEAGNYKKALQTQRSGLVNRLLKGGKN